MSGAEFLEKVRERSPDIVRILLTGHSDLSSTIDAINKGAIYRYLSKPWDDQEVLMTVGQAISTKRLIEEKRLLEIQVRIQNEKLKHLNNSLELKVEERTRELQSTMLDLQTAHGDLKKSFITSIKVFSNLIEMREGSMAGHSRRVADMARSTALQLGLNAAEAQDVFIGALLHDIGKIGMSDNLLKKPYASLTLDERTVMNSHAVKGQTALMALDQLSNVGVIIRHHHERYDGQGFPDGLSRNAIPLGSRILAVADTFDALLYGTRYSRKYTWDEALREIADNATKSFDSAVVSAFMSSLKKGNDKPAEIYKETPCSELRPGMRLARDLITRDGALLLAKDFVLNLTIIKQIRDFETAVGHPLAIHVHQENKD
jgi:putative nucleotidyltransferase with HDIG domain